MIPISFGYAVSFVAAFLKAFGALIALAGGVVWLARKPMSFGLARLWRAVDRARDAHLFGHFVAQLGARVLTAMSYAVWLFICLGGIALGIFTDQAVALLSHGLSIGHQQIDIASMTAATSQLLRPFAIGCVIFGVLFNAYLLDNMFENRSMPWDDIPDWLKQAFWLPIGVGMTAWGLWGLWITGPIIYFELLPQIIQSYFVSYAHLGGRDLLAFVAFISVIASIPFLAVVLLVPGWFAYLGDKFDHPVLSWFSENWGDYLTPLTVFFAGLVTSFGLSFLAAYTGALFDGAANVELSIQVLAANALCDGLTLSLSVTLLRWAATALRSTQALRLMDDPAKWTIDRGSRIGRAIAAVSPQAIRKKLGPLNLFRPADFDASAVSEIRALLTTSSEKHRWRIWPALVVDLVGACLFAYASIYLAFVGTPHARNLVQMNHTFIGGYDHGRLTELGPLFWLMHSSFMPTLIFWSLLLLALICGFVISPLVDFLLRTKPKRVTPKAADEAVNEARNALVKTAAGIAIVVGAIEASQFFQWLPVK